MNSHRQYSKQLRAISVEFLKFPFCLNDGFWGEPGKADEANLKTEMILFMFYVFYFFVCSWLILMKLEFMRGARSAKLTK